MEELGVGRPSTYASVIATILDRGYVWKKGSALVPSFTAFAVVGLLERYFGDLVDYGFTAAMENDLDEIAGGREEALPWLSRFYFGAATPPGDGRSFQPEGGTSTQPEDGQSTTELGLKTAVATHLGDIDAREINSIVIGTDADDREIVVRVGRYGPYLQRADDRASIPDDTAPDELTVERAEELLAAPSGDRELGNDPGSGLPVYVKAGRFGPYVQLGEVVDGGPKPRTSSLFATMTPATLTLDEALQLLQIPRLVGTDAETGEEVVAHNGKFGPYLKRGTDSRSLASEDQLLTVTLDDAKSLFAQPKARRGRRRGRRTVARDGGRPRDQSPGRAARGPVRAVRHGRDDQRVTAQGRRRRADHHRAGLRAARRAPGGRPVHSSPGRRGEEGRAKKATTKKAAATKKATTKKAPAKRAAPKKTTG